MANKRIQGSIFYDTISAAGEPGTTIGSLLGTIVRDRRIVLAVIGVIWRVHCIDDGCYLVDSHCFWTIHAEMNAILQC